MSRVSTEIPLELNFLRARLSRDFSSLLPEASSGSAEARESNFLSRALAAFAVHKLSGCDLIDAANAIVDGGGDGGIDAVYYSPNTSILWIVQSKFMAQGKGEPALGEVSKFRDGLENLLNGQFDRFRRNSAWATRIAEIERCFQYPPLFVRAVLVYSGINVVSDDRHNLFENLVRRISSNDDYFRFQHYNLTSIHVWVTEGLGSAAVEKVELEIHFPGWMHTPYETIYGLVRLVDIAALQDEYGNQLVAANIRLYKGATEVNERIVQTLQQEPHHFPYLNNGITAYCERLDVAYLDRGNAARKRITARGFSVINGAQTLGSLGIVCKTVQRDALDGFVFVKIISLQRCDDERAFAQRLTVSTNFQNQIGARDFVSLDPRQERLATDLILAGIHYHYKDNDDAPNADDENFDLAEATAALASLEDDPTCDFCSRVLANRNSLWSRETVFPAADTYLSRYDRLFGPERSARTIWRAVQCRRVVIAQLQADGRSATGNRKTFFENARALVLHIVFLKLHRERGGDLMLSSTDKSDLVEHTIRIAEALWQVCETLGYVSRGADGLYEQTRHFRSVFSNAADCQRLRSATLSMLAR